MIKFENTEVVGWEHVIRGMRNPMNSWEKSDSYDAVDCGACGIVDRDGICEPAKHRSECEKHRCYEIGPNDLDLMKRLRNAGTDHRKFMRMITVYVDILAPLYWWKEFDTYKVGTVANSCSTMHKIAAKEFTLEDFSYDHLEDLIGDDDLDESLLIDVSDNRDGTNLYSPTGILKIVIKTLNRYRDRYIETKDKKYWWQMIQLLPSSYNQRRTVMLNYEVLANIYKSRRNHKLDEWAWHEGVIDGNRTNKGYIGFCDWIETLPYSELITGKFKEDE